MDLYERNITEGGVFDPCQGDGENNTDWFGELFRDNVMRRHNLSISGGTDKGDLLRFGQLYRQSRCGQGQGVNSYSGMLKLQLQPLEKGDGMLSLRTSSSTRGYTTPHSLPINLPWRQPVPYQLMTRCNPYFFNYSKGYMTQLRYSPINEMRHSGNTVQSNRYNITGQLSWRPITDLTLSTTFGINFSNTSDKSWYDEQSYIAAKLRRVGYGDPLPDVEVFRSEQRASSLMAVHITSGRTKQRFGWQWRAQVMIYNWPLGRPYPDDQCGTRFRSTRYDGIRTTEFGYLPDRE